jgi:molybdate/tungstate transport system permease protein
VSHARVPRLLLVPALVLLAFLTLPLGLLVAAAPPGRLLETLLDPEVLRALAVSAGGGLLASAIGLLLGVPLAYVLARGRFPGRRALDALIDLPVVLPHTAAGVALLFALGSGGPLGAALERAGLGALAGVPAVTAAMVFVAAPFLVRAARDAFLAVDPALYAAATSLGATSWQVFRRVALPLAARGIGTGVVLMWARGVSDFGAVVILAYRPKTLPVLLFERFERGGLDAAVPVGALICLLAMGLFVAAHALAGRAAEEARDERP